MQPRVIASIVGVAAVAFAVNFAYSFAAPLIEVVWNAYQSQSWPQTPGKVIQSAVQHDHKGRPYSVVEYSYSVSGTPYHSHRVQFAGAAQDEASAEQLVASYKDKDVNVYFKPSDPKEAVLRPGLGSKLPLLMLAVGFFVLTAGLLSLIKVVIRTARTGSTSETAP